MRKGLEELSEVAVQYLIRGYCEVVFRKEKK